MWHGRDEVRGWRQADSQRENYLATTPEDRWPLCPKYLRAVLLQRPGQCSHSPSSNSGALGGGLRLCVSNRLPGNADTAGLRPRSLWQGRSRSVGVQRNVEAPPRSSPSYCTPLRQKPGRKRKLRPSMFERLIQGRPACGWPRRVAWWPL